LSVTLTNHGALPAALALSPLAGLSPGLFALDPLSSEPLPVGGTITFEAHFAPLQAAAASAFFTLSGCGSCGELTVDLQGTGVASVLQVSPDPLHFGFVAPTSEAVKAVTIANIGNQVIHLLAPGPTLAPSASQVGFAFGPPQATTPSDYPFALGAGQSAVLPISFVPPRPGFFSGSLSFGSDDVGAGSAVVPMDGYGGGARIACVPSALNFGAVAVDQAEVESVICTNVGSDVPGHPEAALRIGAATASPPFTAAFGPNASDLAAGQSAEIDVTYQPAAAESDTATLTVASNDSQMPELAIALAGQGIVPGACGIAVAPALLSFGEVPVGGSGQQLFEISNTGQSYCLLTDFKLDPSSDPAFSLPGGSVPPALLGTAGNPGGASTSLRVPVQFTPLSSEAQATGKVTFSASGASGGAVPLSGSSAPACLRVEPPDDDFGRVGFDPTTGKSCVSETANFTAQNVCDDPVTVTAIGVSSGLDSLPQFGLLPGPSLPLTLDAGGQFSFAGSFGPTSLGLKSGAITLTSSEFPSTPYQISLAGDAEASGQRTDTFAARQNKVDLLFMLDDDDDLTEIQAVAEELPGFIQAADAAGLDYQIAVTSTDTCVATPSDQGSFEPCDHCTSSVSASPIYFTPQTQNAAQTLTDLFNLHSGTACVAALVGDEQFFQALEQTFEPALLAGHNAGFVRDEAYLAIVVINGDGEDDRSNLTTDAAIGIVQGLKPNPGMVSVSYIDDGLSALNMAYHMTTLVQATGGVILDTATEWVPGFFDLLWAGERLGGFALSTTPDPTTLLVEENGVPFASESSGETVWSYDAASNAVVFSSGNVPVPGTVITVSYSLGCQ